jgi:sigma-E factor negative regulatory protein RseB
MRSKNKNKFTTPITTVLITFSLLLVPATIVFAGNASIEVQKLIDEMSMASRELNYDGVFVYRRARQMNTMRIIHRADKEGEHERLVSLTGFAREVIRDGNKVRCYFPEKQSVMVEESHAGKLISSYLPHPIESISEYYQFTIAAQDRVAGRDAWVVNIIPRDNYRYGYQLWIDQDSKLMLKSELKNSNGVTLEQIMFTQLDVLEQIPDSLLKPTVTGTDYTWYETAANGKTKMQYGGNHWKVTWMPDGFAMSEYGKQSMSMSKMPVDHMVFTDGLAMVSVFIEKLTKDPQVVEGPSTMGGINTFAILSNGYQVTAVGEVPRATVKLMASSARLME